MDISPAKLELLRHYAAKDAAARGLRLPDLPDTAPKEEEVIALARFMAGCRAFLPDDWNGDNRKRNVAIRVFLEFSANELRDFGRKWLDSWLEKHGYNPWFKEWEEIIRSWPDEKIAEILLSSDEEPTRQRISMPFTTALDFETVLKIKRSGMPI